MTALLAVGASLLVGLGSAFVPVLNAEAYALVAAGRSHPALALGLVAALALGQTVGKLVLFEAGRHGSGRLQKRFGGRPAGRAARWSGRIGGWLGRRRTGLPTVLASASLGLPPLAAVSVAAGAAGQRRWEFAALCLAGRTARFAALAVPAAYVVGA
jgi:membrane protein YqaA with SNARE-associated domain